MKLNINRFSATIICALSIALIFAVTALVYVSINSGSLLNNARQAQRSYKQEAGILKSLLLDVAPLNQQEALLVVEKKHSRLHIVEHGENSISVDSVLLKYENGKLVAVCSTQDDSEDTCVNRSE
jgi:hypothetical protein